MKKRPDTEVSYRSITEPDIDVVYSARDITEIETFDRAWKRAVYWEGYIGDPSAVIRPKVKFTERFFRNYERVYGTSFSGFCLRPSLILLRPGTKRWERVAFEDLLTHEFIHSLQWQSDGTARFIGSYLRTPYRENQYERQARIGVTMTRTLEQLSLLG